MIYDIKNNFNAGEYSFKQVKFKYLFAIIYEKNDMQIKIKLVSHNNIGIHVDKHKGDKKKLTYSI